MLSYQHAYHAGGLSDLHKHAALAALLDHLTRLERPLAIAETHAGRGLYDLRAPEALKTREAWPGFVRLFSQKKLPTEHPFMQAVAAVHKSHGIRTYPGSPAIIRHFMRPEDEADLYELHPQEYEALSSEFAGGNIRCHREDGYDGVLALARRLDGPGLVMIDPSYEVKREYDDVAAFVPKLNARWPEATVLVWYPVLEAGLHKAMIERLDDAGLTGVWQQEKRFPAEQSPRLRGSGLYAVNVPDGERARLARGIL
ncbi:23S rRNA (adenine(2030)-N(6))-methyltransferase RlmJ [Lutibaculum baratangense]|uniref:Protein involved in catabolism of external DNA n=1 Tax=Lutibaculum baratangense AMV1 TaxID=631454 RepID=V4TNP2_9HYPH|nr:23S rRNA (adenine(2030)-N(6))-methyltransferase RlmJ [Lutibaculum baratangense]ESR27313.1 Protein involved in catabolism of external DNA [Lutibaculum baratangense AMV1]